MKAIFGILESLNEYFYNSSSATDASTPVVASKPLLAVVTKVAIHILSLDNSRLAKGQRIDLGRKMLTSLAVAVKIGGPEGLDLTKVVYSKKQKDAPNMASEILGLSRKGLEDADRATRMAAGYV